MRSLILSQCIDRRIGVTKKI